MYGQTVEARQEERQEASGWYCGADESMLAGKTILLVEDEAFVREVTCEVLRSAGYRVLTARTAVEATRAYEANCGDVDLLLTDVVLPGESGRTLARRLRGENPWLQALLVTGYPEQLGLLAEDEECLAKPFATDVLLRRVKQLLSGARMRVESDDLAMLACGNG